MAIVVGIHSPASIHIEDVHTLKPGNFISLYISTDVHGYLSEDKFRTTHSTLNSLNKKTIVRLSTT